MRISQHPLPLIRPRDSSCHLSETRMILARRISMALRQIDVKQPSATAQFFIDIKWIMPLFRSHPSILRLGEKKMPTETINHGRKELENPSYQFLQMQLSVAELKVASPARFGALQRRGHLKRERVVILAGIGGCTVASFIFQQGPLEHETEHLLGRWLVAEGQQLTRPHQFRHRCHKRLPTAAAVQQRLQLYWITIQVNIIHNSIRNDGAQTLPSGCDGLWDRR